MLYIVSDYEANPDIREIRGWEDYQVDASSIVTTDKLYAQLISLVPSERRADVAELLCKDLPPIWVTCHHSQDNSVTVVRQKQGLIAYRGVYASESLRDAIGAVQDIYAHESAHWPGTQPYSTQFYVYNGAAEAEYLPQARRGYHVYRIPGTPRQFQRCQHCHKIDNFVQTGFKDPNDPDFGKFYCACVHGNRTLEIEWAVPV